MKKPFAALLLILLFSAGAMGIPAMPDLWQTLTLTDGSTVEARLTGDEYMHYWQSADGTAYMAVPGSDDQFFQPVDLRQLSLQAASRRQQAASRRQQRRRHNTVGDFTHYTGQKKGLVILVEFSDTKFQQGHNRALYQRICNEVGFTTSDGFKGSIYDYFKAQSYGKFDLTFDVVGPVAVEKSYRYYGANDTHGDDLYPGELTVAACQAVNSQVNFADYDWNGDGVVDQVMIIYAGRGEADGGNSYTIWPHEWTLTESDFGNTLQLDGVDIDTYAMVNEQSSSGINGIGTICHEFSHCLGLPDFYDTFSNNYGMGAWSLMSRGNYNGNSFTPAGYTSFERYTCGWLTPHELNTTTIVNNMKPLSQAPEAYLISNEAYPDEFYLLENRQNDGWDAKLPGKGLLVIHIDYDHSIWENNVVNAIVSADDAAYYEYPTNDHQRCTIIRANNYKGNSGGSGDTYPYRTNCSLTNTSVPAAKLYHANTDGKKLMNRQLQNITQNEDGTMAFVFYETAEGGTLVGISSTQHDEGSMQHEVYDLQGRRLNGQPRKGLFIMKNGKKTPIHH